MPFLPGNSGKPPGAINKRSRAFLDVLEKHNFCPATALMDCYKEAKRTYDNYNIIHQAIIEANEIRKQMSGDIAAPTEDNAHKYLKIAADIAKDLASYSYPKLKAIEQQKNAQLEGMTAEQQLEAMKHAVQMLELKIKDKQTEPK